MEIRIDRELCIGCGLCEENLPQLFVIDHGKARLKQTTEYDIDEILATIEDCPAEAISIEH